MQHTNPPPTGLASVWSNLAVTSEEKWWHPEVTWLLLTPAGRGLGNTPKRSLASPSGYLLQRRLADGVVPDVPQGLAAFQKPEQVGEALPSARHVILQ